MAASALPIYEVDMIRQMNVHKKLKGKRSFFDFIITITFNQPKILHTAPQISLFPGNN